VHGGLAMLQRGLMCPMGSLKYLEKGLHARGSYKFFDENLHAPWGLELSQDDSCTPLGLVNMSGESKSITMQANAGPRLDGDFSVS